MTFFAKRTLRTGRSTSTNQLSGTFILQMIRHFREFLRSALLRPKQKSPSLSFKKMENKIQKKWERTQCACQQEQELKRNGPDVIPKQCWRQGSPTVSGPNKGKALSFETTEEAVERAGKQKRKGELGERKKKSHSPPPNQVHFDKEKQMKKVTNMKDGDRQS